MDVSNNGHWRRRQIQEKCTSRAANIDAVASGEVVLAMRPDCTATVVLKARGRKGLGRVERMTADSGGHDEGI